MFEYSACETSQVCDLNFAGMCSAGELRRLHLYYNVNMKYFNSKQLYIFIALKALSSKQSIPLSCSDKVRHHPVGNPVRYTQHKNNSNNFRDHLWKNAVVYENYLLGKQKSHSHGESTWDENVHPLKEQETSLKT